ncbi:MAG: adenylate/guanylate cyclase with Chase sensor [Verrucomicrobia bacterium]|nr:adenylate/guanylate cyclase with Chase sensor [Verrucomicrobiota bacterium]
MRSLARYGPVAPNPRVLKVSRPTLVRRWRWLVPVALLVLGFHFSPLGPALNHAFFDGVSRHPFHAKPPPPGSALVMMDDDMMKELSDKGFGFTWPPPRTTFAALIVGLQRAGASHIVMDFTFIDHSAAAEQDAFLGNLSAIMPEVVLARTTKQWPAFWDETFVKEHPAFFQIPRTGVATMDAQSDGVIRHYTAEASLAAAALPPSDSSGGLLRWHGGLEQIRANGSRVPVVSAGRYIVSGLHIIDRLAEAVPDANPAALTQALAKEPLLTGPGFDELRGRTVFVGASASGTFDQKPFPIGNLEPGVIVHWTAWTNLVENDFITPISSWYSLAVAVLVVAILALFGVQKTGILGPILFSAGASIILIGGAYIGISLGWYFQPSTPVVAAILALIGVVAETFWDERRRREEVQTMFGSYVAPEVVEMLVRDPNAIRLGGERREASVFFCDLAGFTDLSEQVTPGELLELINGYLQETSDCLMEHGAYIDKYIGDAVMAIFGAPLHQPGHALAACRAALAAMRILEERNKKLLVTHGRTLGMRIGINTGDMIMGNLGSERKKNYTVLGDTVNLASRLEGANKEFGTGILLGETTSKLVRDHLVIRPLTGLKVKGKNTAVNVCELVGEIADLTPEKKNFLAVYGEAHSLYTHRNFAEAASAFERAAALEPHDSMTQDLLEDARRFAAAPPPPGWYPTLSLKTK